MKSSGKTLRNAAFPDRDHGDGSGTLIRLNKDRGRLCPHWKGQVDGEGKGEEASSRPCKPGAKQSDSL
jgi:hypothetical protein